MDDKYLDKSVCIRSSSLKLFENTFYKKFFIVRLLVMTLVSFNLLLLICFKKYTIIHTFLPHAYIVGGLISIISKTSIRIMSRRSLNIYQKRHKFIAKIEKILHKKMSLILGNSKAVLYELTDEGVELERLKLIYNGINLENFNGAQNSRKLRKSLGILSDEFVMVIVANLIPYKGHRDLLNALNLIKKKLGKWKLLIVGKDNGIGQNLEYLSKKHGISKNVLFFGKAKNIPELMQASDIGILCSHEEGFSNSLLEYMASGLPVVATDVGGNKEAVKDGWCGYIVSPKRPEKLSEAILRIYTSKERALFGMRARERAKKYFALDKCIDQYEDIYKEQILTKSKKE